MLTTALSLLPDERDALFYDNRRLVLYYVWRYGRDYDDAVRDDLRQVGDLALWTLSQKYEPHSKYKFTTYAGNAIKWAIQEEMSRVRKQRRGRQFPERHHDESGHFESQIPIDSPTTHNRVAATEETVVFRTVVRTLAEKTQELLQSMVVGEIAEIVAKRENVCTATMWKRRRRAVKEVKKAIQQIESAELAAA